MTIGELYPGEFEAMERQGRLDAAMPEQETMNMDGLYKLLSDPRVTIYTESGKTHTGSKELANRVKESEQEPCDDAISRQAVLKLFATHDGKYLFEAIRDLPSVTPNQKQERITDDAISRQAAMRVLDEIGSDFDSPRNAVVSLDGIADAVQGLPSVNPQEPKTGRWIEHEKGFWSCVNKNGEREGWIPDYECSECGSRAWKHKTNYCPNCGARMESEEQA